MNIVSVIVVFAAILAGTLLYQFKSFMYHLTQASSSKMPEDLLNRETKRAIRNGREMRWFEFKTY